jgi:proteic killer suppression protein
VPNVVRISRIAQKQLRRVPRHVRDKLEAWAVKVETNGLPSARRIPGYHDEPLHGDREGQRSVRLSLAYRAFYMTTAEGLIEIVTVLEVNKHDY